MIMEENMKKFRDVLVQAKRGADIFVNAYKIAGISIVIGTFLLDLEMLSIKKNLDREVKSEIFKSFLNVLRFLFDDETVDCAYASFVRTIANFREERAPWIECGIDEEDALRIIGRLENFFKEDGKRE
jgi:hypothetical protein